MGWAGTISNNPRKIEGRKKVGDTCNRRTRALERARGGGEVKGYRKRDTLQK